MRTSSGPLILVLSLATAAACSAEVDTIDELNDLRSAEDPADPAPEETPAAESFAIEVLLTDGATSPDERAALIDGLRDIGVRVLVTLPGGVWLTEPVDPQADMQLEVAGHVLERLVSVEQVEERATQAEAAAAADDAEAFEVERAASFIELPSVLLDSLALGNLGDILDPIDDEAPHALLPADVLSYEGEDPSEANALPEELGGPLSAEKNGPPARDVGKFLRGDVAVRVFFPESTGVGNEDWTLGEYTTERNSYIAALARLARVAPPTVNLVFDYADLPPTDPINAIDDEPTDGVNEWHWTSDILDNLGVPAAGGPLVVSTFLRIAAYEATVRNATGADHVAIAFAVKDSEEPRSAFNGLPWRDAWPHAFFGSYMVTTSTFAGGTFMHELMHVFHAADEYDGGNFITPCKAWSPLGHKRAIQAGGDESNGNHENCNHHSDGQECLMLSSGDSDELAPFARPLLCWYTRAQVGWHDTDALLIRGNYPANIGGISPTPRLHIEGNHIATREAFSYVQDGYTQYGGRRCGVGSATGFTYSAAPGVTTACSNDLNFSTNVNGDPDDVEWPSGPTYASGASFDEGRVHISTVTYQHYYCGDGLCDASETPLTCPSDCTCGNGVCDASETWMTCPDDCSFCGNLECEAPDENPTNCPSDCCVQTGPGPCAL